MTFGEPGIGRNMYDKQTVLVSMPHSRVVKAMLS